MTNTITALNFPIIEVAYVHQVKYDGGNYHIDLSVLLDINGQEVVCTLSGGVDQLMELISPDEKVAIMEQGINDYGQPTATCVGDTTFGALLHDHFRDVIEYIMEGNDHIDLAAMYMETLSRKELAAIRHQIQVDNDNLAKL